MSQPSPDINLDDYDIQRLSDDEFTYSDVTSNEDDDEVSFSENSDNEEDDEVPRKIMRSSFSPLWVLPLYSMLPVRKQSKVKLFMVLQRDI